MKIIFFLLLPVISLCQPKQNEYPAYNGNDLGVTYSPRGTLFKVWAPEATFISVTIYPFEYELPNMVIPLKKEDEGVWSTFVRGDLKNRLYYFDVKQTDLVSHKGPDMYAKAVGWNGEPGMIVDLSATNPTGWANDKRPPLKNPTDIVIYEAHVRDLTVSKNSGIKNKGKFIGIAENRDQKSRR